MREDKKKKRAEEKKAEEEKKKKSDQEKATANSVTISPPSTNDDDALIDGRRYESKHDRRRNHSPNKMTGPKQKTMKLWLGLASAPITFLEKKKQKRQLQSTSLPPRTPPLSGLVVEILF